MDNCVLTFDIDWAPDWMILDLANLLIAQQVRATFFITHQSPAVEQLSSNPLFELGIHPNCLPGSTHGADPRSVLSHICNLVPNAICMRTHGLFQSTNFLFLCAAEFGIKIDCSIFLPRANFVSAHKIYRDGSSLWRIPLIFSDDSEMFDPSPRWQIEDYNLEAPGIKVFNFHPVHTAMNFVNFSEYEKLRTAQPISSWDLSLRAKNFDQRPGPRTLVKQLIDKLVGKSRVLSDLVGQQD